MRSGNSPRIDTIIPNHSTSPARLAPRSSDLPAQNLDLLKPNGDFRSYDAEPCSVPKISSRSLSQPGTTRVLEMHNSPNSMSPVLYRPKSDDEERGNPSGCTAVINRLALMANTTHSFSPPLNSGIVAGQTLLSRRNIREGSVTESGTNIEYYARCKVNQDARQNGGFGERSGRSTDVGPRC
jgi:hypothetical protein